MSSFKPVWQDQTRLSQSSTVAASSLEHSPSTPAGNGSGAVPSEQENVHRNDSGTLVDDLDSVASAARPAPHAPAECISSEPAPRPTSSDTQEKPSAGALALPASQSGDIPCIETEALASVGSSMDAWPSAFTITKRGETGSSELQLRGSVCSTLSTPASGNWQAHGLTFQLAGHSAGLVSLRGCFSPQDNAMIPPASVLGEAHQEESDERAAFASEACSSVTLHGRAMQQSSNGNSSIAADDGSQNSENVPTVHPAGKERSDGVAGGVQKESAGHEDARHGSQMGTDRAIESLNGVAAFLLEQSRKDSEMQGAHSMLQHQHARMIQEMKVRERSMHMLLRQCRDWSGYAQVSRKVYQLQKVSSPTSSGSSLQDAAEAHRLQLAALERQIESKNVEIFALKERCHAKTPRIHLLKQETLNVQACLHSLSVVRDGVLFVGLVHLLALSPPEFPAPGCLPVYGTCSLISLPPLQLPLHADSVRMEASRASSLENSLQQVASLNPNPNT